MNLPFLPGAMTEPAMTPPVPPEERGGNERIGWQIAGTLELVGGWGVADLANLLLHHFAPAGGERFGPVYIGPVFGPYAEAVFGIGLGIGAFGLVLLHLARRAAPGPFVLPGPPY